MAGTCSFDVVSDFDHQELVNAIDQLKREVEQRYDLKDSKTEIDLDENHLVITTSSDMSLQAVEAALRQKATKRNLSLKIFDFQKPESSSGNRVRQKILLKKGLSQDIAKKLSKLIREKLKKINVSIQGDSLRITSKNKDDLQEVISILRSQEDNIELPLQYQNYR